MPKITKAGGATNRYTYPVGYLPSDGSGSIPEGPEDAEEAAVDAQRPPQSARISVWATYVASQGHDTAGLSKRKLIALVS